MNEQTVASPLVSATARVVPPALTGPKIERPDGRPLRLLVFLPSWLGDTVMATSTLRLLRHYLPASVIIGLVRPGMQELLAGTDWLDDIAVADRTTVLGPAKTASRLAVFKLDAALLLPNSFSSAMTARMAGISHRIGYDRDGRSLLLTHKLLAPARAAPHKGWAPVSAVNYYYTLALGLLGSMGVAIEPADLRAAPPELALSATQLAAAAELLSRAGISSTDRYCVVNPGGNNPAKRWPIERFAALAHHLVTVHRMKVLINGSPVEAPLARIIKQVIELDHPEDGGMVACLPDLGISVGSLKGVIARSGLLVTNDTGPRHIAAAFGVPCVTLFGPTDHRWTTLPLRDGAPAESILLADPTLPDDLVADEEPDRCRIDRISYETVLAAVEAELKRHKRPPGSEADRRAAGDDDQLHQ